MFRAIVLAGMAVMLAGTHSMAGFYDDPNKGHEGWYGYAQYGDNETKEDNATARKEYLSWPTVQEAMMLRPSRLKELLEKAADVAIGSPTEENVLRWVGYMHVASVKSRKFANVVAWVRQQHPEFSTFVQHPMTYSGSKAAARARHNDLVNTLKGARDDFAILLFVSGHSPLSAPAQKICRQFARKYGWTVQVIDAEANPTLAEAVGVNALPQAWVISRQGLKPFVAMTGTVTVSALESSVYRGLRLVTGQVEPEGFADQNEVVLLKGKSQY